MKKFVFILALMVFSSSFACAEEQSASLEGLVAEWLQKEPAAYKYHLKAGGVFGYSNIKVSIKDGKCSAKSQYVYGKERTRWKSDSCEGRTITDLIESVQGQEQEGAVQSDMRINADNSFVSYYVAAPKTELTDQDWWFEITEFQVR